MGVPWVLATPEQVEAFKKDWMLAMPLKEMAALHGFRNVNGVSRAARRLGLPKRRGGRPAGSELALKGGRWVTKSGGVRVWVEDSAESA